MNEEHTEKPKCPNCGKEGEAAKFPHTCKPAGKPDHIPDIKEKVDDGGFPERVVELAMSRIRRRYPVSKDPRIGMPQEWVDALYICKVLDAANARIRLLEEPLRVNGFAVDGMMRIGQELIDLKMEIKQLRAENAHLKELLDTVLCEVAVSCTLKYEIKQALKGE